MLTHNHSSKVALFFCISALPAVGCTPQEDFGVLTCKYLDENGFLVEATFCYDAGGTVCKNFTPGSQEWCAWNVFASEDPEDISKFANPDGFAGLEWQVGSCMGTHQESKDFPPSNTPESSCNDEHTPNGSASATETPTDGGNDETTIELTSTTAADTSSSETTGGESDNVYLCSMQSPWKCANLQPDNALTDSPAYPDPYTDPNEPTHTLWDACWSAVNLEGPPLSKCVEAVSDAEAVTKCQTLCNEYREAMEMECGDDVDCDVVTSIDCVLDGNYINSAGQQTNGDPGGEKPVKKSDLPSWECDGEPVKTGDGPFNLFAGSASLVTPEGVTAGVGNFNGYLGYSLSECGLLHCTITVDTLVGLTSGVEGGYCDAEGMGGLFEAQRTGFQMTAPISGKWHRLTNKVTFPTAVMNFQFWADAVLVDGAPVTPGYGAYSTEIDQIVGKLGKLGLKIGPLSLNFVLDLPFSGVVSVSLHTLPPG
jgi:hypothetical protein